MVHLQVVGEFVLVGEPVPAAWEAHAGQLAVARDGEQFEGVPATTPRVPGLRSRVEDHVRDACALEVVAGHQAALSAADDGDLDVFGHVP